ncbi:unnamed protein product [Closterium sp. NIES-64]|nr:unnamed protein product [Closterium sp. NIES-64]
MLAYTNPSFPHKSPSPRSPPFPPSRFSQSSSSLPHRLHCIFHMRIFCVGEVAKAKVKADYGGRVRTFPHVEGNFAVHVFIPVTIPASLQPLLQSHLRTAISALPALAPVDPDSLKAAVAGVGGGAATAACGFGATVTGAGAGATTATAMHALVTGEVHMTAARTVPIRFHQIDSLLSLLRLRLKPQKRFHLHLDKWTAFVNDEKTRSFLALEASREGLPESFLAAHQEILSSLPVQLPEPITLGEGPGIGLARGSQVVSPGSDWSLGDLVKYGADHSHAATSVVVRLREELGRVTSVPTMIAVDEFNAWFTFAGFFESTGDRSRRQIHAGEMRMVNAFRSLEASGIMAAAFSESIAVGRLPAVLPGVPKGVRLNVPRFTVDETLALLQHYQKSCKLGRVTDNEENIKEAAVRACMVTGGNAAQLRNIRHGQAVHNLVMDTEQYKLEKYLDCPLSTQGFEQVAELRRQVAANPPPGFPADLIVVSPLLRTLQTAVGAFGPPNTAIPVDLPQKKQLLRTFPLWTGSQQEPMGEKKDLFSSVDFSQVQCWPRSGCCAAQGGVVRCSANFYVLCIPGCFHRVVLCSGMLWIMDDEDGLWKVEPRETRITDDEDALWKVEPRETREEIAQRATDLATWLLGLKEQSIAVVSHSGFLHAFATVGLPPHLRPENKLVYFENCRLRSYILSAEE